MPNFTDEDGVVTEYEPADWSSGIYNGKRVIFIGMDAYAVLRAADGTIELVEVSALWE